MADVLPPSNLAPESAPWGRALEDSLAATSGSATSSALAIANLTEIHKALGARVESGFQGTSRDIKAVNDELTRRYLELKAADVALGARITDLNGDLQAYKFNTNTRLNGIDYRINAIENKLNLATASSIDGMEFVAVSGGTWYKVPQSVGSPLGGPIKWPFSLAYVTDDWGPRDSPGGIGSTYHRAYDFAGGGTDIKAVGRGTVIFAGGNGGLGNHIEIRHSPTLVTGYSHLASIGVSVGQAVAQGQSIGVMGTTGTSTGVHLHFATSINGVLVNPRDVIVGDDYV